MQKQSIKSVPVRPQQIGLSNPLSKLPSPSNQSPPKTLVKNNFGSCANLKTPLSQIFQSTKKLIHSNRSSQVDITNLNKLVQQQKKDTVISLNDIPMFQNVERQSPQHLTTQSLTQNQMAQLIMRAKEMTLQFKNNHFFSQAQTVTHSRNESAYGPASPNNQQVVLQGLHHHHQKTKSSSSIKQQSFINYTNLKEMMNQKKKTPISQSRVQQEQSVSQVISKQSFNFHYVIGIGGFGKVWKVDPKKKCNQVFAMKEMSKALVITKKSVNSVMNERHLLSQLKHPFIVNMYYAFQDKENLYLVMDYMQGGDLRYHIGRQKKFTEEQTKFFIACIFLGLEHLHTNNIIQRDIKPENLVLDQKGYLRITDMGIARVMRPDNASDTSGTPGYMAPEVMYRQNHTHAVDYYALGVIAFECMLGRRPYVGRSRQEIREQILARQVQIKKNDIPDGWSIEAADIINRMIQRKPQNRLGFSGPHEIKLHPWFKQFPWTKLYNTEIKSPYIPNMNQDNFDQRQIVIEDEENNELIQQNIMILKEPSVQCYLELFAGYEYSPTKQISSTTDQSSGSNSVKHSSTLSSQGKFDKNFNQ